jgi:NAD(P)-dependent dehydrogenase (short-subunit alcohol dehydrogenase family)
LTSLGYEGKRVIVAGAASGIGVAVAQLVVELGAEVHAVDVKKPEVAGLASFTECDLDDPQQIAAAVKKIGKIVNALFACAGDTYAMTEAVIPNMIEGSAIVSIGTLPGDARFEHGIRINAVSITVPDVDPWPMVFLNSPRAAGISGQQINQAR